MFYGVPVELCCDSSGCASNQLPSDGAVCGGLFVLRVFSQSVACVAQFPARFYKACATDRNAPSFADEIQTALVPLSVGGASVK